MWLHKLKNEWNILDEWYYHLGASASVLLMGVDLTNLFWGRLAALMGVDFLNLCWGASASIMEAEALLRASTKKIITIHFIMLDINYNNKECYNFVYVWIIDSIMCHYFFVSYMDQFNSNSFMYCKHESLSQSFLWIIAGYRTRIVR